MSSEPKRVNLIWWIIAAFLLTVFFIIKQTEASERYDIKQKTDVSTDVSQSIGDTVIGGDSSRSYGVGMGSFDVDINQCLASKSWGLLVYQRQDIVENPWCMADSLDARGRHDAAAEIRCNTKTLQQVYPVRSDCIAAVKVNAEIVETPELALLYSRAAQYDADEEERDELIVAQQQEIEYVKEELASIKQKPPRIIYQTDPALLTRLEAEEARRTRAKAITACQDVACVEKFK